MRRIPALLAASFLLGFVVEAKEVSRQEIDLAVKAIAPHPRLLWPAGSEKELKVRLETDPKAKAIFDDICGQADMLLTVQPIEHIKIGKRLLDKSRTCLKRVLYLSMAYRMTGEKQYLERAEKELLTAAGFKDWNTSHYLDAGEMTAALAIGYDWLYADLAQASRDTIRNAIIEKGLRPSLNADDRSSTWWIYVNMNWNQVCNGGLTLGALAIADQEPNLAGTILHRGINAVPRAMNACLPDGGYPEGPAYWTYGTGYNVLMIAALDTALKTDFDLSEHPGFAKSGMYYLQMTGPTGLYFNYSDCGQRSELNETIFWFADRYHQPEVVWNEIPRIDRFEPFVSKERATGQMRAFLPLVLIWSKSFTRPKAPETLCWFGHGENPVAVLRSGWETEATYFAVKSGSPSVNHGHMDVGSFVMDASGVRWATDLGSQNYARLEEMTTHLFDSRQNSDRWKIMRYTNYWHNTLTVNNELQRADGIAPMIRFSGQAPNPQAIFDLTDVYRGQLEKAVRCVTLHGRDVTIQDQWKAEKNTVVRWSMVTGTKVKIESSVKAVLKQDDKTLLFEVNCPKATKIQTWPTEPRSDWDEPNPGTQIIGFEVTLPAGKETSVTVTLTPEK